MRVLNTSSQQARFLAAFAQCGQVQKACRWCNINRHSHYGWMREDPTYPARFEQAEKQAARMLRDEAVRRAHDGIRKPVWYKGKIVGYEIEYSDTLMLGLLKALDPEFKERFEHSGIPQTQVDIRAAIMQVIQKLPEDSRAMVAREMMELEKAG